MQSTKFSKFTKITKTKRMIINNIRAHLKNLNNIIIIIMEQEEVDQIFVHTRNQIKQQAEMQQQIGSGMLVI